MILTGRARPVVLLGVSESPKRTGKALFLPKQKKLTLKMIFIINNTTKKKTMKNNDTNQQQCLEF